MIERFHNENLPFSVAVIDMDWHLVDIDSKYGNGWTGFTWNRKLFPQPERFLSNLHQRGMKVTLNVHPADGIRAYEDAYPKIAKDMGIDPESGLTVEFDPADPKFLQNYYADVIHPLEEQGVDFWWVDWQQGTHTRIAGLDPLWMLNHYGFWTTAEGINARWRFLAMAVLAAIGILSDFPATRLLHGILCGSSLISQLLLATLVTAGGATTSEAICWVSKMMK